MPNLVYVQPEAAVTWAASGGTNLLTLTSLAASAGRQGALHDFGALTARSRLYVWRAFVKFATTPVVDDIVEIYAKTGDGTHRDNDDGTGDAAVSAQNKLKNLTFLGAIVVDEASTTPEFSASGLIEISAREFAPVIWNATVDALSATAADHGFELVPVPDEVQ